MTNHVFNVTHYIRLYTHWVPRLPISYIVGSNAAVELLATHGIVSYAADLKSQ